MELTSNSIGEMSEDERLEENAFPLEVAIWRISRGSLFSERDPSQRPVVRGGGESRGTQWRETVPEGICLALVQEEGEEFGTAPPFMQGSVTLVRRIRR